MTYPLLVTQILDLLLDPLALRFETLRPPPDANIERVLAGIAQDGIGPMLSCVSHCHSPCTSLEKATWMGVATGDQHQLATATSLAPSETAGDPLSTLKPMGDLVRRPLLLGDQSSEVDLERAIVSCSRRALTSWQTPQARHGRDNTPCAGPQH